MVFLEDEECDYNCDRKFGVDGLACHLADDDNPMRGKLCDGDYKQMLQIWGTPASCYY